MSPSKSLLFLLLWLSATGSGFLLLGAHDARPGGPGSPPGRWPEGVPIPLDPARPTLLIFLHPRCPCSSASVDELAAVSGPLGGRFAAHAILYRPEGTAAGWDGPGVDGAVLRRRVDPGGELARRFGVETSGHVLLYGPGGGLLFEGGITPTRGHRGENDGLGSLVALIEGRAPRAGRSPVFGCPILDPRSTLAGGVAR